MNETPELGRQVVLLTAVIAAILESSDVDRADPGLKSILTEIDALNLKAVHRYRSAAQYDDTPRGRAALADLLQVIAAIEAGEHQDPLKSGVYVEIIDYTWSPEQLNGPIMPGMEPNRKLVRRHYVDGFVALTTHTAPIESELL